jgi:hypothetical protein
VRGSAVRPHVKFWDRLQGIFIANPGATAPPTTPIAKQKTQAIAVRGMAWYRGQTDEKRAGRMGLLAQRWPPL